MSRHGKAPGPSPATAALDWIRNAELPTGGIRVHSAHANAYPEVTGYIVPTLVEYGEPDLARRLVRWLMCIQRGDGSFTDPDTGESYIFDTGQALRGLLAGASLASGALAAARRAAQYLCERLVDDGGGGFGEVYQGKVPESVHLYALEPLVQAAQVLSEPQYERMARRAVEHYIGDPQCMKLGDLTHFVAYAADALIDLGMADAAKPMLDALRREQGPDGGVRGVGGESWVCTTGLAQLAICWYKTGQWLSADAAMSYLEAHQSPSGGFRGSVGEGASYFQAVDIAWAAKFFLDANRMRVAATMDRIADDLPGSVRSDDGRLRAVLAGIKGGDRVVEVGCGKGRFLAAIQQAVPDVQCTGVDIAPGLLAHLGAQVEGVRGALERIPLPDESFDVVFSVEAVEHSANLAAAIREMCRVAKPGGLVAIVDKGAGSWGRLECPPWERWPTVDGLKGLLNRHCDDVTCTAVSYDSNPADGLMLAWVGRKRAPLSGPSWHRVLITPKDEDQLVSRVRGNHVGAWEQEILLSTEPGQSVLEVGSGTGEMSLMLAQTGRLATAFDISDESLAFARKCAERLGLKLRTMQGDATRALPLADGQFDVVWSSGLLDRVTPRQRRAMIAEFARVARKRVVVMVANAASVAYRAGMDSQQRRGVWPYGYELPIASLRDDFEAAGLRVTEELSRGSRHSLNFLQSGSPLRSALAAWMGSRSDDELSECNQGYMIVTKGDKAGC
jgi:malonyl-CoA O-methyltransferase